MSSARAICSEGTETHGLRTSRVRQRRQLLLLSQQYQSYLTLCNPIDGNPPGSSVPGIFQARTLEWVAISFSKRRQGSYELRI